MTSRLYAACDDGEVYLLDSPRAQEEGGFTVLVLALPEVVTEGDDQQEALANAEQAIRAILAYRRNNGIRIPSDARPEIRRITVAM
jgi:antitoxin HicB